VFELLRYLGSQWAFADVTDGQNIGFTGAHSLEESNVSPLPPGPVRDALQARMDFALGSWNGHPSGLAVRPSQHIQPFTALAVFHLHNTFSSPYQLTPGPERDMAVTIRKLQVLPINKVPMENDIIMIMMLDHALPDLQHRFGDPP